MGIPFSIEQFFSVFAQDNESVWPMQVILNLLALVAIILLYRARPLKSRVLLAVLSFLWGWMAIAYHFAFFTTILSRSPPVSVTTRSFPRYVQEARSGCVG
jgi:uncharacterized protein DUF6064